MFMNGYKDKFVTITMFKVDLNIDDIGGMLLKSGNIKVKYKKKETYDTFFMGDDYIVISKKHGLMGFTFRHTLNWGRYNRTSIKNITCNMFSLYHRECNWSNSRIRFSLFQSKKLQLNLAMMYCNKDYQIFMDNHGLNLDMSNVLKHYIPPSQLTISWAELKLNSMYYFHMENLMVKYRRTNTRLYSARQNRQLGIENEFIRNSIWTCDYNYVAKTLRQIDITDYKKIKKHNVVLNDDVWKHIKGFMGLVNHSFKTDKRMIGMTTHQLINLAMYVFDFPYWDVHYFVARRDEEVVDMIEGRAIEYRVDLVTRNESIMKALEF